jgi:4-carboxymuconolactone decarboxylase
MRYPVLNRDQMNDQQREVAAAIESRSPGGAQGPYAAMLYSPEMADRAQQLGVVLQHGLRIPERLRVLAVLIAAGRNRSEEILPFAALESVRTSTLSQDKINVLAKGDRPSDLSADELAVYEFCTELVSTGRVKSATYEQLVSMLDREIALELVALCGFTAMLTNVLNITQTSITASRSTELI